MLGRILYLNIFENIFKILIRGILLKYFGGIYKIYLRINGIANVTLNSQFLRK